MNILHRYENIFSNEVRLMTLIRDILGPTWDEETNSYIVNGSTTECTDHENIDLPNEIEQDAINWAEFSKEVIEKVIERLKLIWHKCCNK